jgi:Uma2 family endonuclease
MSTAAVARAVADDPTFYPSTDHMGESTLQVSIAVLLLALIERWLVSRGKPVFVGLNTFFYWKQGEPRETVAPDLYVLPGVSLTKRPPSWKVWETGKVPSFALEIVSTEVDKDYVVAPDKYDRLGVRELVVIDPRHQEGRGRLLWQVYRRVAKRGLVRVEATNGDRVRSRVLDCWLVAIGRGDEMRVRLGTGPDGDVLFPTDDEARACAEAERAHAEAERERAEAKRERAEAERAHAEAERDKERSERASAEAERDKERAERERAEAELARLRAEIGLGSARSKRRA